MRDATSSIFDHDDWYKTFGLSPWQYVPDDLNEAVDNFTPVGDSKGADRRERLRSVRDLAHEPRHAYPTHVPTQPFPPSRSPWCYHAQPHQN